MKWRTDREKEKAIDDIAFRRREREREKSIVNVVVSSDARRCVDFDVRETYTKTSIDANTFTRGILSSHFLSSHFSSSIFGKN